MDLRSKFLRARDPYGEGFMLRMRRMIATIIYPPLADKTKQWYANYFNHEYMVGVHNHYQKESRQLNKAIAKKNKRIRELEKQITELKSNHESAD